MIPFEFLRSVVCVWINGKVAGTGFVISPEYVLTCAHVVSSAHVSWQIQIEFLAELYAGAACNPTSLNHDFEAQDIELQAAETRTLSSIREITVINRELDVALLLIEAQAPESVRPAQVAFRTTLVERKARTWGFPLRDDPAVEPDTKKTGRKNKRQTVTASDVRNKSTAMGKLPRIVHGRYVTTTLQVPTPNSAKRLHFQLNSSGHIEPGFSGAPVCDSITGEVIGMIRICDVEGAAPHAHCIPLEEMRKSIPQIHQLHQRILQSSLTVRLQKNKTRFESQMNEFLSRSPKLAAKIAAEIGANPATSSLPATILEDRDLDVSQIVNGLGRLFAEATSEHAYDSSTANLIVGIYMAYAPAEIWKQCQSTLRSLMSRVQGIDDDDLVLPCDELLLEVYMAAMDGRVAEYHPSTPSNDDSSNPKDFQQTGSLRGKYHIDLQPETGIGKGELPIEAIRNRIEPHTGLWRDARLSEAQKRQRFNDHLKYLHDIGQTRYLSVISQTPSAAQFTEDQLIEFGNVFRHIAIVQLDCANMSPHDAALIGPFAAGHFRLQAKP